jgi:N-acetylneuraminic acid mutarotase
MASHLLHRLISVVLLIIAASAPLFGADSTPQIALQWEELPPIPTELGLAGPIVGVHNDALIVAGGANFPQPIWESSKQWHQKIFVMAKREDGFQWQVAGQLPKRIAYAACVSTNDGVLCLGGNDADNTFDSVFLLSWDGVRVRIVEYPKLPKPCAYGQATIIGNQVYLAGGQSAAGLDSAMTNFWRLTLESKPADCRWEKLPPWPGPARAFNLTMSQHNGFISCVYVISGRTEKGKQVDFLKDVWEFNPATDRWRRRADAPASVMAGTGIEFGSNHLLVLGGADGSLFTKADELKDAHPGFPKKSYAYHTITDSWVDAGATPANHVTTQAVRFDGRIVIPSGEVRPRVRSPKVWSVQVVPSSSSFGVIN